MSVRIIHGDARDLSALKDGSIHCVATSETSLSRREAAESFSDRVGACPYAVQFPTPVPYRVSPREQLNWTRASVGTVRLRRVDLHKFLRHAWAFYASPFLWQRKEATISNRLRYQPDRPVSNNSSRFRECQHRHLLPIREFFLKPERSLLVSTVGFRLAEFEQQFGLCSFYHQKLEKRFGAARGHSIRGTPGHQWFAVPGTRRANAESTPERGLQKLRYLWCNLLKSNALAVNRRRASPRTRMA